MLLTSSDDTSVKTALRSTIGSRYQPRSQMVGSTGQSSSEPSQLLEITVEPEQLGNANAYQGSDEVSENGVPRLGKR